MDNDIELFKDAWAIAVAKAWEDESFRADLLNDARLALESLKYTPPPEVQLKVITRETTEINNLHIDPILKPESVLILVLPDTPAPEVAATSLAQYLRNIDPPENISCLC